MKELNQELEKTHLAAEQLMFITHDIKSQVLCQLAKELIIHQDSILKANSHDLNQLDKNDPKYDRLLLSATRIESLSTQLKKIARLPSPIWKTLEEHTLPNGLLIKRKSVPLGVIGLIYEARPNVTIDAFALCWMSSNACVLKGGKEATLTNELLVTLIHRVLTLFNIPISVALLLPSERDWVKHLLSADKYVDVIIPRGSQALIDFVKENSKIPVIETGAGVVHLYFDDSGEREIGKKIIGNAKTRRVSVCNALDCLIIHQARLKDLPFLVNELSHHKVTLLADPKAYENLTATYPSELLRKADLDDFGTEFLDYQLAIKTVAHFQEALHHIRQYSSRHSEAIIATDQTVIQQFFTQVDAAVVYANASTAFTDGDEFGMGGEIGISTQKLHVRGPFSMQHLVSSKWIVEGNGQIRA